MSDLSFSKNLALIGAGRWGKNLARNFYQLGALHTLCDARKETLDSYQSIYPDVQLVTNYEEVLKNPAITAVAIASPAVLHYALAKQALLAGKDVFVEKPLCLDSSEGEELIKLAEEKGLILMVGHLLQFHPCIIRLQELLGRGELGKLHYIVSNRLNLGSIRTEENALWSFAPHDISVILSLAGHQLPNQIRCTGADYLSKGVADTTMTTMRFANDVRAHIYVSWLHPFKEQKLVVIGSTGMAVFDDTKPWEEKLLLYRNHVTWTDGNIPQANKNDAEKVALTQAEPLQEECTHFLKCCKERIPPRTNGKEGLQVLKVLQAAQASLNEDGAEKNPHLKNALGEHSFPQFYAHPTAIIGSQAEIEAGTKIWHFSHIMDGAKIGQACNIGQNVVVSPAVVLGKNVKVQNNVSIYTGVICEDDVFLGPSMVFTNVINPRSAVNRRGQYQTTTVRKGATIGANATIVCGIELGAYSFIGSGAVVTKNVPPFALMVGNPARQMGWMSRHGEKLDLPVSVSEDEVVEATCPATGEIYRLTGNRLELIPAVGLEVDSLVNMLSAKE
ncbi:MAG: oxidoreductase [Parachlamydia sp.]|nr:MAG: oxidoreductase [Parachlamydia sp.]